jgi:hypothetical protein
MRAGRREHREGCSNSGVHIPREISRSEGPLRARFATVQWCVIIWIGHRLDVKNFAKIFRFSVTSNL